MPDGLSLQPLAVSALWPGLQCLGEAGRGPSGPPVALFGPEKSPSSGTEPGLPRVAPWLAGTGWSLGTWDERRGLFSFETEARDEKSGAWPPALESSLSLFCVSPTNSWTLEGGSSKGEEAMAGILEACHQRWLCPEAPRGAAPELGSTITGSVVSPSLPYSFVLLHLLTPEVPRLGWQSL